MGEAESTALKGKKKVLHLTSHTWQNGQLSWGIENQKIDEK